MIIKKNIKFKLVVAAGQTLWGSDLLSICYKEN